MIADIDTKLEGENKEVKFIFKDNMCEFQDTSICASNKIIGEKVIPSNTYIPDQLVIKSNQRKISAGALEPCIKL